MQSLGGVSPNLLRVLARLSPDLVTELFAAGKVLDAEVISVFQDRAMLSFGKGIRLEVALQAALKAGERVKVQVQPREQGGALVLRLVQPPPGKGSEQAAAPTVARVLPEQRPTAPSRTQPQAPTQSQPQSLPQSDARTQSQAPQPNQVPEAVPNGPLRPEPLARSSDVTIAAGPGRGLTEAAPVPAHQVPRGVVPGADGSPWPVGRVPESPLPAEGTPGLSLPPAEARAASPPADPATPGVRTPDQPASPQAPRPSPSLQADPAQRTSGPLADPRPQTEVAGRSTARPGVAEPRLADNPHVAAPDTAGDLPLPARADAAPGPSLAEGEPAPQSVGRPESTPQTAAQTPARLEVHPSPQAPVAQARAEAGQPPLMWIPVPLENGKQGWAQLQIQEGDGAGGKNGRVQHQVRLWWETPHLGQVQVTLDASQQSLTALFTVLMAQVRQGLEQGLPDLQTRLAAAGFDDVKVGCRQALPGEPIGPVVATESNSRLDRRL